MTKLEADLDRTFTSDQRNHILYFTLKSSICTKILILKSEHDGIIQRGSYINYSQSLPIVVGDARRNGGILLHIFWSCFKLKNYWKEVQRIVKTFTDHTVPDDPAFFLPNASTVPVKIYKQSVVRHILDAVKACIPLT